MSAEKIILVMVTGTICVVLILFVLKVAFFDSQSPSERVQDLMVAAFSAMAGGVAYWAKTKLDLKR